MFFVAGILHHDKRHRDLVDRGELRRVSDAVTSCAGGILVFEMMERGRDGRDIAGVDVGVADRAAISLSTSPLPVTQRALGHAHR